MDKPVPGDDISVQIFSEVYSQELLHVLDEVRLVNTWLPPRIGNDSWIQRNLVRGEPLTYGRARDTLTEVDSNFREYVTSRATGVVRDGLWAAETSRRSDARDSPVEYRRVQDRIEALRRQC